MTTENVVCKSIYAYNQGDLGPDRLLGRGGNHGVVLVSSLQHPLSWWT